MDQESLLTIIKILSGAFVTAGGVLILVVTWVVLKTFNQNEEIKTSLENEFRKIGQQLADVRQLVKDEVHELQLRMNSIEEWRKHSEQLNIRKGGD